MLYCNITSQVKNDKDQDLLEKVGGDGFPHIAVMDAKGMLLAPIGRVARTTQEFRKLMATAEAAEKELGTLRRRRTPP